jgi:superfamily I DNA and/or RNA helicase
VYVVQSAPIIATTTNGLGQKIIRQNAGISERFRGIAIVVDEAGRECEANIYVPLTKLTAWNKIVGLHMIGDYRQGQPIVPVNRATKPKFKGTNFTQQGYNEFVGRGEMSLFGRLIMEGFPVHHLDVQYRMHPLIVEFPNRRFYSNSLTTGKSAMTPLRPEFVALCKDILGFSATAPQDIRLQ